MAAVKEIEKSIKSHQYVSDSIAYILSPENRKCYDCGCNRVCDSYGSILDKGVVDTATPLFFSCHAFI